MTNKLSLLQTGYAAARSAFEYKSSISSPLARGALFAGDLIDTACTGWKVVTKLQERDYSDTEKFCIDLAVKAVALAALAFLFVKGTNRVFFPQLDPTPLLHKTTIPKVALDYAKENNFEIFTAAWTKLPLENWTTGLFFIRTIFNLYLGSTSSDRLAWARAAMDGTTTFKASQYRTLEIKKTVSFLLERTQYLFYPSKEYPILDKYFSLPVKKVEAVFHLNTNGLSEQSIVQKIQAVCDYSAEMFKKSIWGRYWFDARGYKDYYGEIVKPFDQALSAMNNFGRNLKLKYTVALQGAVPPAPLKVYIQHEDEVWRSFKGIDIFQWIPRFCVPGERIKHIERVEADLTYPLGRVDQILNKILSFLKYLNG